VANTPTFTANSKKGAGRGSRHLEPVLFGGAVSDVAAMIRQTTPAFTAGGEHNEFYLYKFTALMLMFFLLVARAYTSTTVVYHWASPSLYLSIYEIIGTNRIYIYIFFLSVLYNL
jgi:hypothetical protein